MRTVCERDKCAGCMACVDACAHEAVTVQDGIWAYNAVIDPEKCVNCGLCERVCQQLHPASLKEPIAWRQGWASDPEERATSSSGGVAAAISKAFVQHGGLVCSCAFQRGRFGFEVAGTVEDLRRFKGSKYVKSDPSGAYREVRTLLRKGRKVLFIGLPCQVSSMRNFCCDNANLYTIDLICHGTPSPKILDAYLGEHGISLSEIVDIRFRKKSRIAVENSFESVEVPGVTDRYSIAFLGGLDYTENCYWCVYAHRKRVSDITLGDSWGSELDGIMDGISLALCQTEKGKELLEGLGVELRDVDLEKAISANGQLDHPTPKLPVRRSFLTAFGSRSHFSDAVLKALPKECFRQDVKRILISLNLWKPSGGSVYELRIIR